MRQEGRIVVVIVSFTFVLSIMVLGLANAQTFSPESNVQYDVFVAEYKEQQKMPDGIKSKIEEIIESVKGKILPSEGDTTIFELKVDDKIFQIKVTGKGIKSLHFVKEHGTMTLENDGTKGRIDITIPKELLDGEFTVMADGQQINFLRSDSEKESKLTLDKPDNSSMITIQGTIVIPEFPVIILTLAGSSALILFYSLLTRRENKFP
jgi:hypothetical protein